MLAGVMLSGFLQQPTPAPSASPMKTITHVTARPLCTLLHRIVLPFAKTEHDDNDLFVKMDKELATFRSWDNNVYADTGQAGSYTANGALNLEAGQLDQQAAEIYQRVADIEKQLAQSYHDIPPGKDQALDELRARIDNICKLQYALAAKYDLVAGRTLNASALPPALAPDSQIPLQDYNNNNPLDYTTPAPARPVATPGTGIQPVSKDLMFNTPTATVEKALIDQENGFTQPALNAVRLCDGP